jgi:L-rhamnose mutarotase
MEKYAWSAKIVPGKKEEYKRRHDEIWPELVELLRAAGIKNYTIWNVGDVLFGYYECSKGIKFAADMQKNSPIVAKWDEYMKDVLIMEMDENTGAQPLLECVFELD